MGQKYLEFCSTCQRQHCYFYLHMKEEENYVLDKHQWKSNELQAPTIPVYVDAAGVSLSVLVSISLQWVALKRTVITAVSNPVSVWVVLPRIVYQRAVVLPNSQTAVQSFSYVGDYRVITHLFTVHTHTHTHTVSSQLINHTSLPSHPWCHHCHHRGHRRLLVHHCPGPLVQSWAS